MDITSSKAPQVDRPVPETNRGTQNMSRNPKRSSLSCLSSASFASFMLRCRSFLSRAARQMLPSAKGQSLCLADGDTSSGASGPYVFPAFAGRYA